jgi:hypothetical protein
MNSIFDESDAEMEEEIKKRIETISELKISPNYVLHEGRLTMQIGEGDLQEGFFLLLYDRLIYCESEDRKVPIGITSIKWKRVEPFTETDVTGQEKYGFKLTGHNNSEDFYT